MQKSKSGSLDKGAFRFFHQRWIGCLLAALFLCFFVNGCKEQQNSASEGGCPPCIACEPCPIPPACTPVEQEEVICEPCVPKPKTAPPQKAVSWPHIQRLEVAKYPKFEDDLGFEGFEKVLLQSIAFYNRVPATRPVRFGTDVYSASHMKATCNALIKLVRSNPDVKTLNEEIKKNYLVYRAAGTPPPGSDLRPKGKVLFTGYYEPLLRGSHTKSEKFSIPLYGPPEDLVTVDLSPFGKQFAGKKIRGRWNGKTFVPYHDWEAINYKGALEGKIPPLVYINDEVDKFFLQVQGSGIVFLDDGSSLRVHYKAQNGRPYHSIGAYLVQAGRIPKKDISMQSIREYLKKNPGEQRRILSKNPSYVFFEVVKDGPLGALSVPLTGGRALAVDRKLFPDAAPAFIQTQKPLLAEDGQIKSWQTFSRFMAAQDTGGAIKGSGRADVFWGNGDYAEIAAGHMQHPGEMYFLVMKPKK